MEEKNCLLKQKNKSDHRLKKNKQFNFIFKKGERLSTKNFNLFIIKSKYKCYKLGYSISKKQGKAHQRNLLKRRLREIIRLNNLPCDFHNYVVQAKNNACELSYQEIEKQIVSIFNKKK